MPITGEYIHSFTLIDLQTADNDFSSFFTFSLEDAQSKHIASIKEHTRIFHSLAQKVSYEYSIVGSHRKNTTIEDERNRIRNMMNSDCLRAARFVICKNGKIWADNTHWTISYILRYGSSTTIQDIPAYIIDFRKKIPCVVNKGNVVFDSITSLKSAVASAKRIQERVDLGWRPSSISYTIRELIYDMELQSD